MDAGVKSSKTYTVREAVEDWLREGLDGTSERTRTLYEGLLGPLLDAIGARPLRDLSAPLPPGAAGEVGQAARAIVAETGAAGQAAVATVAESRRGSAAVFLAARQARLAAAADEVAAAAKDGSAAMLSRPCAGSRRSPRRCGRCSPICGPRRRRRPAHLAGPAPGYARRTADLRHLDLESCREASMAGHHLHQHVEVSDDGRTVAAAEAIISEEPGGTARVSLRAEAGHITPGPPCEPGRRGAGPSPCIGKRAPGGGVPARRWRVAPATSAALPGRLHPPGGIQRPAGCEPSARRLGRAGQELSG